jgi:hypothetical protein
MPNAHSSAKVVDLKRFREARTRELPLFDESARPERLRLVAPSSDSPAAQLTNRAAEHRRRMLQHLGAMLSACRS